MKIQAFLLYLVIGLLFLTAESLQSTNRVLVSEKTLGNTYHKSLAQNLQLKPHTIKLHGGAISFIQRGGMMKRMSLFGVAGSGLDFIAQSPSLSTNPIIGLLGSLMSSYSNALHAHPHIVKIISSGVIGGTGDVLIQSLQRRNTHKAFDFRRLVVFTSVAAFYIAPVINLWFNWLSSLPILNGLSDLNKALIMTAIDQTAGALIINAGFFYAFELAQRLFPPYNMFHTTFLEAGSASVSKNMWETLVANWYCWPGKYVATVLASFADSTPAVINFLNFLFVPLQYRLLVSNLAAVFWNMFLSSIANRKK